MGTKTQTGDRFLLGFTVGAAVFATFGIWGEIIVIVVYILIQLLKET